MLDPAVTHGHAKYCISRVNDLVYALPHTKQMWTDESFWCSTYQGLSDSFWCIRLYDRGITSCQSSGGKLLRVEAVSCHLPHMLQTQLTFAQEAEITNAGLGSNLTLEGSVEADASIMLGDRTFAAVGAAPGLYIHSLLLLCPMNKDGYTLHLAGFVVINDGALHHLHAAPKA